MRAVKNSGKEMEAASAPLIWVSAGCTALVLLLVPFVDGRAAVET